jgi:hypothetical protein
MQTLDTIADLPPRHRGPARAEVIAVRERLLNYKSLYTDPRADGTALGF